MADSILFLRNIRNVLDYLKLLIFVQTESYQLEELDGGRIDRKANLLSDRAPVTQCEALASQRSDHREVLLEIAQCLDHELEQFSLPLVILDQMSLLETLELNKPFFDSRFQVRRLYALERTFEPQGYLIVEATSDGPQLI